MSSKFQPNTPGHLVACDVYRNYQGHGPTCKNNPQWGIDRIEAKSLVSSTEPQRNLGEWTSCYMAVSLTETVEYTVEVAILSYPSFKPIFWHNQTQQKVLRHEAKRVALQIFLSQFFVFCQIVCWSVSLENGYIMAAGKKGVGIWFRTTLANRPGPHISLSPSNCHTDAPTLQADPSHIKI